MRQTLPSSLREKVLAAFCTLREEDAAMIRSAVEQQLDPETRGKSPDMRRVSTRYNAAFGAENAEAFERDAAQTLETLETLLALGKEVQRERGDVAHLSGETREKIEAFSAQADGKEFAQNLKNFGVLNDTVTHCVGLQIGTPHVRELENPALQEAVRKAVLGMENASALKTDLQAAPPAKPSQNSGMAR